MNKIYEEPRGELSHWKTTDSGSLESVRVGVPCTMNIVGIHRYTSSSTATTNYYIWNRYCKKSVTEGSTKYNHSVVMGDYVNSQYFQGVVTDDIIEQTTNGVMNITSVSAIAANEITTNTANKINVDNEGYIHNWMD